MVYVTIEPSKGPPDRKGALEAAGHLVADTREGSLSPIWLPVATLAGALLTFLVVAVTSGGPGAWWQEVGCTLKSGTTHALVPKGGAAAAVEGSWAGRGSTADMAAQLHQQVEQHHQQQQQRQRQRTQQGSQLPLLPAPWQAPAEEWAQRLAVPWGPLLTRHEVARGIAYGSGSRTEAVARKLLAGQPLKVYALGGSVTRGIGSSQRQLSYVSRFFEYLNTTFPHSGHAFYNRGIGGTNSGLYAVCAEHMVEEDADLVVLEFTINDPRDTAYTAPERRAYEQLLRKLLALRGRPALIQLHHYAWWHAVGDGEEQGGLFYYPAGEQQLGVFAQYYDFPSVSVRGAMWRLMAARARGFNPDRQRYGAGGSSPTGVPIPAAEPGREADYWYRDRTHPGDEGHGSLAELLAGVVARAVLDVVAPRPDPHLTPSRGLGALRSTADAGQAGGLPPPMVPGNQAVPTSLCAMEEGFRDVVTAAQGFEWRAERPDAPSFVEQKWGWTGSAPGDWAEMVLDTAASFQDLTSNRTLHAQVSLSFLRSYEGMGVADVACVAGCSCVPATLDGTWDKRVSLQHILPIYPTRHERCRVCVTIAERPGAVAQQGHKVSLTAVMVSHWLLSLQRYESQLAEVHEQLHS